MASCRADLQELSDQSNGQKAGRAAHARQVVSDNCGLQPEMVHHSGGQGRCRVEHRAVHHQNVNLQDQYKCFNAATADVQAYNLSAIVVTSRSALIWELTKHVTCSDLLIDYLHQGVEIFAHL